MPKRNISFVEGHTYHIFNKTVEGLVPFSDPRWAEMFIAMMSFFRYNQPLRFSYYKHYSADRKFLIKQNSLINSPTYVSILAYNLMPNHFHLLLKPDSSVGVSKYVGRLNNAFSRTYNEAKKRHGPLFFPQFKAELIETDEQLLQTSRYIHLQQYTSGLINDPATLPLLSQTSLHEYMNNKSSGLCEISTILKYFDNSPAKYLEFVLSGADDQRLRHDQKNDLLP